MNKYKKELSDMKLSDEYKENLKQLLIQKSSKTATNKRSIWNLKRYFILAPVCIVLLIAGLFLYKNMSLNNTNLNLSDTSDNMKDINNLDININNDKFSLMAMKSDKQGIETSTSFKLSSKEELTVDMVNKMITIEPKTEYKVEELSNTLYNIIPLSNLNHNSIYKVSLNNEGKKYSWAFQTKNNFSVTNTIPSANSQYAPIDTGIEMNFSMSDLEDIDDYFTIEPHVDGKFIYKDNTVIYTVEKLSYSTNYTITIKAGYGPKNSEEELQDDYVFRFMTTNDPNVPIYFSSPLTSIFVDNTKYIMADVTDNYREKSFNINIYKYDSFDKFYDDLEMYVDKSTINEEYQQNVTKISSITQKVTELESDYGYNRYFLLPDDLKLGYYLVEFVDDNNSKYYNFVQINDMLAYSAFFDKQIFITAMDGKTSSPIKGAAVEINRDAIGKTDKDGVMLSDLDYSKYENTNILLTTRAKGYNDLIVLLNNMSCYKYYDYAYYNNVVEDKSYLSYLDTDRPVYMPTDTINVWGYARPKDSKLVNKVSIELVEQYTNLVLAQNTVKLSNAGTYQTKFDINGFTSGSYMINVYDNNVLISSRTIDVTEYTKPLYTIAGELDKDYLYSGEKLNYKVNANFFDGSPVPNIGISYYNQCYDNGDIYSYNNTYKDYVLDENGEVNIDVDTNLYAKSWHPVEITLNSSNVTAEDKNLSVYNRFLIFPKHTMLEIEPDEANNGQIDILLHSLNLSKYDENDYTYKCLRDKALSGTVNVNIVERYTEQIKVKEEYDFINKRNVTTYDYKRRESTVYNNNIQVVDGLASVQIPNYNDERNYIITVVYNDNEGQIIETYGYSGFYRYSYYNNNYTLDRIDSDAYFRINDDVELFVQYDNKAVENSSNDRLIILMMNNGLIDYRVCDTTEITTKFKEEYIPNVVLQAIYVKDGVMNSCNTGLGLRYDISERNINVSVKPDKEDYKPGETVKLDIITTDEKGNPKSADVNISIVDEAYFALYEKTVDTLSSLYRYNYDTGLRSEGTSNKEMSSDNCTAAEMGGDGSYLDIIRDEFKDTNMFETVTTDKKGKASISFTLADNLTKWRITAQAISKDSYAGSQIENINVSMPLFVDMIVGKEYLTDDNIGVALRTFGTEAKNGENVQYKVILKDKVTDNEKTFTHDGIIGDYTNIEIGKLDAGEYDIVAYVSYNNMEDAIQKEFEVAETLISFNNTSYYKLSEDTVLSKVYSNPVITLYNESTSDFYNSLSNIAYSDGLRVDQKIASIIAAKYINEYFEPKYKLETNDLASELMSYQKNKGVALLTYSSEDTELTAKLDNLIQNDYINNTHKAYFNEILNNSETYSTHIAAALWGLSKYNEPVLLDIYNVLDNNSDLPIRDKIYLSLALTELGDIKTANKCYQEILNNNCSISESYINVNSDETVSDSYELTSLMMVLAGKLNDYENGDKLFKYIYDNPSKYTLSNLEQLSYIINRDIMSLPEINDLFGSVTVVVNGKEKTYELKLFDTETFAVKKDEISGIRFKNIKGQIACKVNALGNVDNIVNHKTDDFSISASYNGGTISDGMLSCKQSDIIRTELQINSSEDGMFEVTYVIPAGFRYVDKPNDEGIIASRPRVDGQKLTFYVFYDKERPNDCKINFYMQAAQKGKYTVDYIVVKEWNEDKLNYIEKSSIMIK